MGRKSKHKKGAASAGANTTDLHDDYSKEVDVMLEGIPEYRHPIILEHSANNPNASASLKANLRSVARGKLEKLGAQVGEKVSTLLAAVLSSKKEDIVREAYDSYVDEYDFFPYQAALYIGQPAPYITLLHILVACEYNSWVDHVLEHSKTQKPEHAIDVTRVDSAGDTPLHIAVYKQSSKLCLTLVNFGFSVLALNQQKQCPLSLADESLREQLYAAAELQQGVDPELFGRRALIVAIKLNKLNLVQWLIEDRHVACNFNDEDDKERLTPVMLGLKLYMQDPHNFVEKIVQYLRSKGVNPNLKNGKGENFETFMKMQGALALMKMGDDKAKSLAVAAKPPQIDNPNMVVIKLIFALRKKEDGAEIRLKAFLNVVTDAKLTNIAKIQRGQLEQALGLLLKEMLNLKHTLLFFEVANLIPQQALITCIERRHEIMQGDMTDSDRVFANALLAEINKIILLPVTDLKSLMPIKELAEDEELFAILICKAQTILEKRSAIPQVNVTDQLQSILGLLGDASTKLQPVMKALYAELIKAAADDYSLLVRCAKLIVDHDVTVKLYSLFGAADSSLVVRKALMVRGLYPADHEPDCIPQLLLQLVEQYLAVKAKKGQKKALQSELLNYITRLKDCVIAEHDLSLVIDVITKSSNGALCQLFEIEIVSMVEEQTVVVNSEQERPPVKPIAGRGALSLAVIVTGKAAAPKAPSLSAPPVTRTKPQNQQSSSRLFLRERVGQGTVRVTPAAESVSLDGKSKQLFEYDAGEFPALPGQQHSLDSPPSLEPISSDSASSADSIATPVISPSEHLLQQAQPLFLKNGGMVAIDEELWQAVLPQCELAKEFEVGMKYSVGSFSLSIRKATSGELELAIALSGESLEFYATPPDPSLLMIIKQSDGYYGIPKSASRWEVYKSPLSAEAPVFVPSQLWQPADGAIHEGGPSDVDPAPRRIGHL